MARYRAKTMLFVDGQRIRPGQEFSSESPPTPEWELIAATAAPKTSKAAPAAEPAPAAPLGAPQRLEDMDEEQLRDFIQTKSPSQKRPSDKYDRDGLLKLAQRFANQDGEA